MTPRSRTAVFAAMALGAFAGGFFCGRTTAPASVRREVVTEKETVTIVQTFREERETKSDQTERIVERRIAIPCRCGKAEAVAVAGQAPASAGHSSADSIGAMDGMVVLDERIVERALSTSERLTLSDSSSGVDARSVSSVTSSEEAPASSKWRWRVGALVGYQWNDAEPEFGLSAGMRLAGPVEVGVWGVADKHLNGAAGVSVGVAW